jgi:hypothetical protein
MMTLAVGILLITAKILVLSMLDRLGRADDRQCTKAA